MGKFRSHGNDKGKGISLERFAAGKVRGANKKTSKKVKAFYQKKQLKKKYEKILKAEGMEVASQANQTNENKDHKDKRPSHTNKPDPFLRAVKRADEKKKAIDEARKRKEEQQRGKIKQIKERKKQHKDLSKKTRKGQPVLLNTVQHLLSKIKSNS